ncbi:ROK family transcriptional regulator [Pseudonocardia sp. DSM 110487]|uniref:ROK family protein n=1 Tax=Pseudonocardia sp. DSM 110487 TaxID=2865833 RepID=UPI001C6A5E77|nr:ROK family protein [Pseudonocardia sp. DSM 110487]QYN32029.1 ROK family transcriptional regulator [Pseudonocardia sp. DSM 110487]
MLPATATDLRQAGLARALTVLHAGEGELTRADLARALRCTRATAAALASDLRRLGLAAEVAPGATGRRGRPSPRLVPALGGPVVVALEIGVDAVRVATAGLGGRLREVEAVPLARRDPGHVLAAARELLERRLAAVGPRCAGVGIAAYGLVAAPSGVVVSAPNLGWTDEPVLPRLGLPDGLPAHVDNVAHLWALADARPGSAAASGTVLFLHSGVGLGGALVVDGRPLRGRSGLAGEFGHLPVGRAELPCRCGARGCWEPEVDQAALARAAGGDDRPDAAAATAARVLGAAAAGDAQACRAVHQVATALGRGIGALVTAHDPDLVVLAGHAADLLAAAGPCVVDAAGNAALRASHEGLPPIRPTGYPADGGLVGAAEAVLGPLLDDPAALAAHAEVAR